MYDIVFSRDALKDIKKAYASEYKDIIDNLLRVISEDPFRTPPAIKQLTGDKKGLYSRRINRQHRLVYEIYRQEQVVHVISAWGHYDD